MILKELLKLDPFSISKGAKKQIFKTQINHLTMHHYKNCKKYKKILKNLDFKPKKIMKLSIFLLYRQESLKNLI